MHDQGPKLDMQHVTMSNNNLEASKNGIAWFQVFSKKHVQENKSMVSL